MFSKAHPVATPLNQREIEEQRRKDGRNEMADELSKVIMLRALCSPTR